MTKGKNNKKAGSGRIAENRRARFDYHLDESIEAGIALEGWEVKSIRSGKAQISESYVLIDKGEAWLFGAHITPLISASTHIKPDQRRSRKLLLHRKELDRLIGMVERKGYTLVPVALYWKNGKVKAEIALARGKKVHDKRATEKQRDWQREKNRILKKG